MLALLVYFIPGDVFIKICTNSHNSVKSAHISPQAYYKHPLICFKLRAMKYMLHHTVLEKSNHNVFMQRSYT